MGLSFKFKEAGYIPTITCDTCNQSVDDWAEVILASPWPVNGEDSLPVQIYHRGECDPAPRGHVPYMTLNRYLPWLLGNNGWGERSAGGDELTVTYPEPL